jgi:hypothetical protein
MIIKLTFIGLILVLILVITVSYYSNKEGFDDISNAYISNNLGNAINTVSPELISVPDNIQNNINSIPNNAVSDNSATPTRNEVVPEVSISGSGYNAMSLQQRADLLKDIQKIVRNEVLANRNTTPIINDNDTKTKKETDSVSQGKEYENSCYKDTENRCPKNPDGTCPPIPDMSQYIKKDAIPCWGCSLDY